MGNFEKLSVLVIGVIIVMILVVAIHTWTSDPATPSGPGEGTELSAIGQAPDGTGPTGPLPGVLLGEDTAPVIDPHAVDPWDPDYEEGLMTDGTSPDADAPEGDVEAAVEEEPDAPETPAVVESAQRTITVKSGDTLGHISLRAYGTTKHWKKIAEANNVSPKNIRPNMVLVIPEVAGTSSDGDAGGTLSGGARPASGSAYKVRRGDTIQSIAKAAYGSIDRWPDIWFENMERISDPEDLATGIEISIP